MDDDVAQGRQGVRHSVSALLARTDALLREGRVPGAVVWPTGLPLLDKTLRGGLRSGELILVAGAQGQGKTTFGLQLLRGAVAEGRTALCFSYEHESHTLLERLIAMEAAYAADTAGDGSRAADVGKVRALFENVDDSGRGLTEVMAGLPHGAAAMEAVTAYADRLHVHESGPTTTVEEMAKVMAAVTGHDGQPPIVLVDYLQKVPAAGSDEQARSTEVVESLKDLALETGCPIIAIAAAEKAYLGAGHRMRAEHLRGSSALAYEADIVLVLSSKADIVSREHLIYDLTRLERFREWVIVTVEKNRHGTDHVELEFEKDFAHGRFLPHGGEVMERLIDERLFRE